MRGFALSRLSLWDMVMSLSSMEFEASTIDATFLTI